MIFHIEPSIWARTSLIRADSPPTATSARSASSERGDDLVAKPLDQVLGRLGFAARSSR